jgi:hypothetical protein
MPNIYDNIETRLAKGKNDVQRICRLQYRMAKEWEEEE